jgi:hypothetical protein
MPKLMNMNTEDVKARIERRGNTKHLDYFEQLLPSDKPVPEDKKHVFHLENIAGQLLLASWQPLANQFYSLVFFLLKEPDAYAALVKEIREAFTEYAAIDTEALGSLSYLHGCVQESLRLHQDTVDGLPRVSPGAVVDGNFIPQGVSGVSYPHFPSGCYSGMSVLMCSRLHARSAISPQQEVRDFSQIRSSFVPNDGRHQQSWQQSSQSSVRGRLDLRLV